MSATARMPAHALHRAVNRRARGRPEGEGGARPPGCSTLMSLSLAVAP